ncbi:major facilitator superfamily domain-containing protein [Copromyces sp. CBS 386.78]|nr:major facilitator superfamily domain-containing protein [Copromyces sp. CBS 386.78]
MSGFDWSSKKGATSEVYTQDDFDPELQTPEILAPRGAAPTISKEEPGSWIPSTPDGSTHASEANEEKAITNLDFGWRPWKVVMGCFCLIVPSYGLLSSIGLFQTEWKQYQLRGYSKSEISWIISIFGFFGCFFAAPCGILYDRYGPRLLLQVGSTIYVASFIGLAFSTTYGQFMACFVVAGISVTAPTTVGFTMVSQWFKVREGLATGCVTVGSAIGGIFFSLVLQALFNRYEWRTGVLILAGIIMVFMTIGNLLAERNESQRTGAETGDGWDFTALRGMSKSPKFWLICVSIFAYEMVLFSQWGSIPSYAVSTNFGDKQFYLMMTCNFGAIIGRTLPPWLSDRKLGPVNTIIIINIFTMLVVLVVWLPFGAMAVPALFVVTVLMGVGTGSFVPLGVQCVSGLCTSRTIGTWLGFVYMFSSFATLLGNPATEAILSQHGPRALVAFLAGVLVLGLACMVSLRFVIQGGKWILVRKI